MSLKRQSLLVGEPKPAMAKHTKINIFFKLLVGAYNAPVNRCKRLVCFLRFFLRKIEQAF